MGERAGSHIILIGFSTKNRSSVVSPDTTYDRPHRSEDATKLMGGCSVVSPDTTRDRPHRSEEATMAMSNRSDKSEDGTKDKE